MDHSDVATRHGRRVFDNFRFGAVAVPVWRCRLKRHKEGAIFTTARSGNLAVTYSLGRWG